jgi:hypothetical protein
MYNSVTKKASSSVRFAVNFRIRSRNSLPDPVYIFVMSASSYATK